MRVDSIELRQLEIPMTEPMAAAYGTTPYRQTILVHLITDIGDGWGECVALNQPLYAADWSNGEWEVLKELFLPVLLRHSEITPENIWGLLSPFRQHNTSKCALEMAVLDVQLKSNGISLAEYLEAEDTAVECSYVVGLSDGDALMRSLQQGFDMGYKMIKLKIMPGRDVDRVDFLRREFPEMSLRVDANASYDWRIDEHRKALLELDDRGLALIEQPFHADRIEPLREFIRQAKTPIALDETLTSRSRAMNVLDLELADCMILKPGMLGGYLVAKDIQNEARRRNVPTMVGGMVETAIGRAANLALAASTENVEYPAEIAPDGRWFEDRLNIEPVEMIDGRIAVPSKAGLIDDLDWRTMERLTRRFHVARRQAKKP